AECLERAIARAPRHAPLWLALGRDLAQVGPQRSTDALRALQRAVSCAVEDEVRADALAELGVQYWKQGLYDFSRDAFDQAHAINPDHLTARIGLIGHDIRAGRIAQASDSLDALGVLEPVKGALLDEFLQQGLDLFVQARRWFPDTVDNHLAYAKTLARANRFAQAIPPLERALALRPDDFVSWNLLGSACRVLDDTERARQAFSRSLEINPDQPRTRDALAELAQSSAALPPEGRSQSQ
ncbi:MAG: tetratricopeptide repeat protein, partial [Candidatus Hydrogenedentes bacterium]|nr:tetratricopeptide repeat protein [Candidatus Hydrogenedentota bacterium]